MLAELSTQDKILFLNQKKSAPVFPKSFYSSYTNAKTGSAANVKIATVKPLKR